MENKYLKAFNFLFNYEVLHKNVPNVGRATKGSLELECWNNLKELVDKETPMKTIHKCEEYEYHLCRKCKSTVNFWDVDRYCSKCGQRIEFNIDVDWSEE